MRSSWPGKNSAALPPGRTLYTLIIIIALYANPGNCCMPGYEGERVRLRQYLGIEWTPQGLDKMDAQKPRNLRHPSELNCDFSNPDDCKWRNSRGLDSLDFHLFKKEDITDFPVVQVRPGPSKVAVGDQLIFVGDKKRTDQSAMLTSFPIKCQNSTGKLTFTFWIYNGARVEVLILEQEEEGAQMTIFPEKPQVDCGTWQVETECSVMIPPREQPFILGIRAYDIRNQDGSFMMLDNILYEAQFCKVSNFGAEFKTEPLITAAEGSFVKTASDLNCRDFDKTCRWRNGGIDDRAVWKRGLSPPSETLLFNSTGTFTAPTAPFAFVYIEEGHRTPKTASAKRSRSNNVDGSTTDGYKLLVSDPVQCVSSAASTITFRVWVTKGIQLSVCALDIEMNEVECQRILLALSPAPVSHHFQLNKPFMFAFRIDEVNPDFDNFAIVDDIEFGGSTCAEASNPFDLGSDFYTTPMLSVLQNRPIHTANVLNCDFSRRALDCQWSNLEGLGVDVRWEVGLGKVDGLKFSSLTNSHVTPIENDLAIARLLTRNATAILVSERLQCTVDSSTLSFRYWHTGLASLSVCIVRALSFEAIDCQMVDTPSMELVVVDVPNFDESIRIALRADSYGGEGIVAVDDITFDAKICSTIAYSGKSGLSGNSRGRTSTGSFLPSFHPTPDENVCRLLSCNFNSESMCLYSSFRVASSVGMFRAFNSTAFTMLFHRSRMAVLESPVFRLNAPARLHFDLIINKGRADLHICQDSVTRELDSCFTVMSAKNPDFPQGIVIHDFVELLPTDTKVYMIAKLDKNSRKAAISIDNIELTDGENHKIC